MLELEKTICNWPWANTQIDIP